MALGLEFSILLLEYLLLYFELLQVLVLGLVLHFLFSHLELN